MEKINDSDYHIHLINKFDRMSSDFAYYRGMILEEVIIMEYQLNIIISNYFCHPNMIGEFTEHLLNTEYLTLGGKGSIFNIILQKEKFKEFKNKNNLLIQNIAKWRKERNYLAHCSVDWDEGKINEYNGEIISLVISKNSKNNQKEYNMKELDSTLELIGIEVNNTLSDFIKAYFPQQEYVPNTRNYKP